MLLPSHRKPLYRHLSPAAQHKILRLARLTLRHPWGLEHYPEALQREALADLPPVRNLANRLYLSAVIPLRPALKALWDFMGIPHSVIAPTRYSLGTATGSDLDDVVGFMLGIPRKMGETDFDYRVRAIAFVRGFN